MAALKSALRALVLNPRLKGKPKDLAVLMALGDAAPAALDALDVGDKGNRSRYQTEVRRALSPARVVISDKRRRSARARARKGLSPAEVVISDNRPVVTSDNRRSSESDALTSENAELTVPATIVLPPGGTDTSTQDTDTEALALELLRTVLGAEVIAEHTPDGRCDARGCTEPPRDCGTGTYCERHAKMLGAVWPEIPTPARAA